MRISKRNLKLLVENYLSEAVSKEELSSRLPLGLTYIQSLAAGKKDNINDKTDFSDPNVSQAIRYVQVVLGVVASIDKSVANFGSGTKRGVTAFQKEKGIAASGVIGSATAQAILDIQESNSSTASGSSDEYDSDNPKVGTLIIAESLNALLDKTSIGWIEDLFVDGEVNTGNLAKLDQDGCAEWVNAWMSKNSDGYEPRSAAWLGYDPSKPSNFITNLNSSTEAQEKQFEKAFNLMCGTGPGMENSRAENIIDSLGSAMALPSDIAYQIEPGHLVGLKYWSSSYLGQAAFESSIATAGTEKNLAPGSGTRIRSQNFFKDEDGNFFSRKKLDNNEYDFGPDGEKTPLKFVSGRGLIGLNTHIGVCIGKITTTDEYTYPIIAHNVHKSLHVAVLNTMSQIATTKEATPSQVLWVDKTTKISGLKARKFKNIGLN